MGEHFGILAAAWLISLGLLPTAICSAAVFKDKRSAKRLLLLWTMGIALLSLAFGFSLMFNHFG